MNTCFTLYDDPKWDFPGKKIIDKKYHLDLVNSAKVKLLSTIKIGESKYLVKLSTCIESNPKPKYLLMTTDKEQVLGSISRPSKTPCTSFWGVIFANYPENTQFSWQYEDPASSKTVRKLF